MTNGFLSNLFTCEVQRAHTWNLAFQNFSQQIGGLERRILNATPFTARKGVTIPHASSVRFPIPINSC